MALASLLTIACLACTLPPGAKADPSELQAAGLRFQLPDSFEPVKSEPPLLLEAVARRHSVEAVRLRVFIVPCTAAATPEVALEMARSVATPHCPAIRSSLAKADPSAATGRIRTGEVTGGAAGSLFVRPVDGRRVAALITGSSDDVTEFEPRVESALDAAGPTDESFPVEPGREFVDEADGIRLVLPRHFSIGQRVEDAAVVMNCALDYHLGLSLAGQLEHRHDDLDVDFEEASKRLRAELIGSEIPTTLTRYESMGGAVPAQRLSFVRNDLAYDALLIDAPRRRLLLTFRFEAARSARLAPAIETCFRSLTPRTRKSAVSLADPHVDAEAGFSIRAPLEFAIVKGADGLVAFEDPFVKPTAARITVRLAEQDSSIPGASEAIVTRARARREAILRTLADAGWSATSEISVHSFGGSPAARYTLERSVGDSRLVDRRTLLFTAGRTFEASAVVLGIDVEVLSPVLDAAAASMRPVVRQLPIVLADAATSSDGRLRLQPPEDWRKIEVEGALLAFEPASGEPMTRIVAGIAAMPSEAALSGLADRYRQQSTAALEASGATLVRVVSARPYGLRDGEWLYRFAYVENGRSINEHRVAKFGKDSVGWMSARCTEGLAEAYRQIFEASFATMTVADSVPP